MKTESKKVQDLARFLVLNGLRAEDIREFGRVLNGGKGSGNFGHAGRIGKVGGSSKGGGRSGASSKAESLFGMSKAQVADARSVAKVGLGVDPLEVETKGIGRGMTKASIVGVAGNEIPEKVPRLNGLSSEQKKIENDFAQNWEDKTKREAAVSKLKDMFTDKDGVMTIETDKVKELDPNWGSKSRIKELSGKVKSGEATSAERAELNGYLSYQQRNNTVLHQTANVLAKEVFRREVSERKARGEAVDVLVTSGGCAVGKGFGLEDMGREMIRKNTTNKKLVDGYNRDTKASKNMIIWDSAGDQNATELPWVASQGARHVTFVHTVGDAAKNASNEKSGLVQRAIDKGRMVDTTVYAQSYSIGNHNFNQFYQNNKDNKSFSFYKVENPGAGNGPTKLIDVDSRSRFEDATITGQTASGLVHKNLRSNARTSNNKELSDSISSGADFFLGLEKKRGGR